MPKTNEQLFEEAERQERQLVTEAIRETEEEIFKDAFDDTPDENDGDNSLEQMDGDDVPDTDDLGDDESGEPEEGEGEEGDGEEPEPDRAPPLDREGKIVAQDRRGVPPGRLREEADRARVAEAEREAARAEARELRARLDALERNQRQPGQQQQQRQESDIFADPEGWAANERAKIRQEITETRLNGSFGEAHEQYGDKFVEAFRALEATGRGGDHATVQRIVNSYNPGRALMDWHGRQALLSEIGNDPNAYRAKVREELLSDPEFRKELLTGMRADAMRGDGGRPRTQTRLPPSLNAASGGTSHRGRDSVSRDSAHTTRSIEQEIFASAWDDN